MNPFDWRGPLFLLFYAALGTVVVLAVALAKRRFESRAFDESLVDPLLIALLRGGRSEVLRVVLLSLVDRGLLCVEGDTLRTTDPKAVNIARRPIEKAVLQSLAAPTTVRLALTDPVLMERCAALEAELQRMGLLPDASVVGARILRWFAATSVLLGVAAYKVSIAFSRGRPNVGLLILLAVVFVVLSFVATLGQRTRAGDVAVKELKRRFEGLRSRATSIRSGGADADLALLAAVFGIAEVPLNVFPHVDTLFPAITQKAGLAPGSSCASSCSDGSGSWFESSSGSSCGSSCGGGCGGGCGGCGS